MSSQKQCKRAREIERENDRRNKRLADRLMWLERRPPWWRFGAVRRWRQEEPV